MKIRRWDPYREFVSLSDRMARLFDEVFTPFRGEEVEPSLSIWTPPVDIYETSDKVVIKAEVPGVDKDHIKIEYKDGVLTLKGERKFEKEVKEENYHRIERAYGTFHRSFSLPSSVEPEKISAKFKDGILEIELPKSEKAKPKEIKIDVK